MRRVATHAFVPESTLPLNCCPLRPKVLEMEMRLSWEKGKTRLGWEEVWIGKNAPVFLLMFLLTLGKRDWDGKKCGLGWEEVWIGKKCGLVNNCILGKNCFCFVSVYMEVFCISILERSASMISSLCFAKFS
ncbi:hypothetical protein BDA96_04G140000 [Sorghum bicolor]|uniref:Uncharacterized protein n=1 Tax=Sorghum bicolor TaxID=4558 RepID=A0A921R4Z2_SORBI|nr:hypothetical protein BDA96_04G140000 [Sorghum bicolor]